MRTEVLRDAQGREIGRLETTALGATLYDPQHRLLGRYHEAAGPGGKTYSATGKFVGEGNQLTRLLPGRGQ
jgi:hypothetical protein